MDNNIKILEIKEAYDHHKDYLQEILKKASIYNDDTINQIMNNFPGLFSSVNEIKRVLYGNYIDEKDFLKRPLSKFTKDILDELKK